PEWWRVKNTRIMHLTRQIEPFSKIGIKIGGNKGIVNATSTYWGPSWKMIVHMDSPIEAYGIYPGGQSGNPGSVHYTDFIESWAAGEYYQLNTSADIEKFSEHIINSFQLNPTK
ncbi:MAG: penicillin acylase family protein, partial [Chitinophagales bacterium]|nr:penicillin acylase family protein [Chitinophagales bacterium]